MANHKKLTDEMKDEIIHLYFEEDWKQVDLAKKFKVAQGIISGVVNDPKVLSKLLARTSASRVRAQMRINRHLGEAVDTQIRLMQGEYEDQYKYLAQNAARDILDRGGVRMEKEEKPDTQVVLNFGESGGFNLGVPDHSKDEFDENELPEEV
jgi:hypothetical protein